MATITAKDLWDIGNIEKFSVLAIQIAKDIIKNTDEIDELYEWLDKQGRSGFTNEDEVSKYVSQFLAELMIVECQNYIDTNPFGNAPLVIEKINQLEKFIGKLPGKAKVLLSLSFAYMDRLEDSIKLAKEVIDD